MKNTEFYEFGKRLAASAFGEDPRSLAEKEAALDGIKEERHPCYGAVQRMFCKCASDVLAVDGPTYYSVLFDKLANARPWWPEMDLFYDAVLTAAGRVKRATAERLKDEVADGHRLVSGSTGSGLSELLGGTAKAAGTAAVAAMAPDVLAALVSGSVLLGAGGGTAAWLANRHISQDTQDNEALKEKIKNYKHLAKEIEDELKTRGLQPTRENILSVAQPYTSKEKAV